MQAISQDTGKETVTEADTKKKQEEEYVNAKHKKFGTI